MFASTVKNVGLSKVDVRQRGTALVIEVMEPPAPSARPAPAVWTPTMALPVLERHGWIEAGETVAEDHVVVMAAPVPRPVRATFRIVQDHPYAKEWNATMVLGASTPSRDEPPRVPVRTDTGERLQEAEDDSTTEDVERLKSGAKPTPTAAISSDGVAAAPPPHVAEVPLPVADVDHQ